MTPKNKPTQHPTPRPNTQANGPIARPGTAPNQGTNPTPRPGIAPYQGSNPTPRPGTAPYQGSNPTPRPCTAPYQGSNPAPRPGTAPYQGSNPTPRPGTAPYQGSNPTPRPGSVPYQSSNPTPRPGTAPYQGSNLTPRPGTAPYQGSNLTPRPGTAPYQGSNPTPRPGTAPYQGNNPTPRPGTAPYQGSNPLVRPTSSDQTKTSKSFSDFISDPASIMGATGAAAGLAGAVMSGMALHKVNKLGNRMDEYEDPLEDKYEDKYNTNDRNRNGQNHSHSSFDHTGALSNPNSIDRIISQSSYYYQTFNGKKITVSERISMDDWDIYALKMEQIYSLTYGYNPLPEITYEAITESFNNIRNRFQTVGNLPVRISESLAIDWNNDILVLDYYRLPEQPDFTFDEKEQILANRERISSSKTKFLIKTIYTTNHNRELVKDNSASSNIESEKGQRDTLLRVLGNENLEHWLRGDQQEDIEECKNKLINNFSYGEPYPILFASNIALTSAGSFIILKPNK